MKRWSKCWRKVLNRVLSKILINTDWHAYVGEKKKKTSFRQLTFRRDGATPAGKLVGGNFEWSLFKKRNKTVAFMWTLSHDPEDTFLFHVAVPWLFSFFFVLDIDYLDWIKDRVGEDGTGRYGFEADSRGFNLYWQSTDMHDTTKLDIEKKWTDIHGRPSVVTTTEEPLEVVYTQPGGHGYTMSTHEIRLMYRRTTWKWPRFWKRDKLKKGYEVSLDSPPSFKKHPQNISEDKIYGMFIADALTPLEAIERYTEIVQHNRAAMYQQA